MEISAIDQFAFGWKEYQSIKGLESGPLLPLDELTHKVQILVHYNYKARFHLIQLILLIKSKQNCELCNFSNDLCNLKRIHIF